MQWKEISEARRRNPNSPLNLVRVAVSMAKQYAQRRIDRLLRWQPVDARDLPGRWAEGVTATMAIVLIGETQDLVDREPELRTVVSTVTTKAGNSFYVRAMNRSFFAHLPHSEIRTPIYSTNTNGKDLYVCSILGLVKDGQDADARLIKLQPYADALMPTLMTAIEALKRDRIRHLRVRRIMANLVPPQDG